MRNTKKSLVTVIIVLLLAGGFYLLGDWFNPIKKLEKDGNRELELIMRNQPFTKQVTTKACRDNNTERASKGYCHYFMNIHTKISNKELDDFAQSAGYYKVNGSKTTPIYSKNKSPCSIVKVDRYKQNNKDIPFTGYQLLCTSPEYEF